MVRYRRRNDRHKATQKFLEGEEHKKDKYGKNVPLGPPVHTGDVA